MSDFSRRSFLKSVCLGGIALSLPKQMDIVAATMKDIEDPPIMAAYAKVACPESFMVYSVSMMGAGSGPMTLSIFTSYPKAQAQKLLEIRTPGIHGMSTMLQSFYLKAGPFIEIWCAAWNGAPIFDKIHVSIAGYSANGRSGNYFSTMSVTLDHVRLERTRAIKLGLISLSEPEAEETEVTGELILRN